MTARPPRPPTAERLAAAAARPRSPAPRDDRPATGAGRARARDDRPATGAGRTTRESSAAPRAGRPATRDDRAARRDGRPATGDRTTTREGGAAPRAGRPAAGDGRAAPRTDRPAPRDGGAATGRGRPDARDAGGSRRDGGAPRDDRAAARQDRDAGRGASRSRSARAGTGEGGGGARAAGTGTRPRRAAAAPSRERPARSRQGRAPARARGASALGTRPGTAAAIGAALWDQLCAALARARGGRRVSAILVVWLVLMVALGWRLVIVQVVSAEEYRESAADQTARRLTIPAVRGRLLDRDGSPLALSVTAASVYANPRLIAQSGTDPAALAARLAEHLDVDPADIAAKLTTDQGFEYLARQVPFEVGEAILAADPPLPGIGVLDEPLRTYPAGRLAGTVIGFAGRDNVGLSGLEAEYEELLAGEPGLLEMERAPGGVEIAAAPREAVPAVPGTDIALTLDREIQARAEGALTEVVERTRAEGGAAVVLDTATGEVLAMASAPAERPDGALDRNRAVSDAYEPGSVQKVVTVAAGLEEGVVAPDEVVDVPASWSYRGSRPFSEQHPGRMTVAEIMARSSNVGTMIVADRLGPERLHDWIGRFGYTRPLGLPGENPGLLPAVADWSNTSLPTIAIGHGVSANLLQVTGVFATIARGGEWVAPTLVRGTIGPDGRLQPAAPPERRRVVSEETARQVRQMLAGVVTDEGGTGGRAGIEGYDVAGKTGTARKVTDGRYEDGAYISTFAGFAPADDPELVVAVMVDEPREGSYYAGQVAAPVFQDVLRFALAHERVAPTDPVEAGVQPAPTPTPSLTPAAP